MSATHGVSIQLVEDTARAEQQPSFARPAEESEAEASQPEPALKKELDLTPDEWSDVD